MVARLVAGHFRIKQAGVQPSKHKVLFLKCFTPRKKVRSKAREGGKGGTHFTEKLLESLVLWLVVLVVVVLLY